MIKKLNMLTEGQKQQFIDIYYESFIKGFDKKRKYMTELKTIFVEAVLPDYAAAYIEDERTAGIVAYSNSEHSVFKFSKDVCREQLGRVLGSFQYGIFEKVFGRPTAKDEDEGYIDFLAVHEDFRRRGIATGLLEYAYRQQDKPKYILAVKSKNKRAVNLYKKQGYERYDIKKDPIVRAVIHDTVDMMRLYRKV